MPRPKRGAVLGRSKETTIIVDAKSADVLGSLVPFAGVSSAFENDAYSLHSRALQTQRHQCLRESSNQRLRHAKVAFVSAGNFKGSETKESETSLAHMTLNETSDDHQSVENNLNVPLDLDQDRPNFDQDKTPIEILKEESGVFFVDSRGSEPVVTGLSLPQIRSSSPTISSSSDEVILFAGRDTAGRGLSKPVKDNDIYVRPYNAKIRTIDDRINENESIPTINAHNVGQRAAAQLPAGNQSNPKNGCPLGAFIPPIRQSKWSTSEFEGDNLGPYRHNKGRYLPELNRGQERAMFEDYVSNVEIHDMNPTVSFNQRDLGGMKDKIWQAAETSRARLSNLVSSHEWGPSNLTDNDIISTSDELLGSAQVILSKRTRKNGLQYLVVWEHCSIGEARWIRSSSLQDINSMELIARFEAEKKLLAEITDEDGKTDSSTDIDHASAKHIKASKDSTNLLSSRFSSTSDEKPAELLAKQEELGTGSSKLLLFDEWPGSNLEDGGARAHHTHERKKRGFRSVRNSKHMKFDFPAASDLADGYDGFDIMDFERPSLKKKPTGRKGRPTFDLSDSELEASMAAAWDKNRSRKWERKEERQALRLQGLLGKKDTKPDVKAKYKEGMDIHIVKEEIKSFLIGENSTLALPPMDKADRKIVHELANAFNLKSKSAGSGNKRFPVLYRTQRTSSFSEAKFSAIDTRLTSRFFPRMDLQGRYSTSAPKRSGRGSASNGAVSYRDGDVVGGSAPELGIENKGRAMLEKMGWSTGTALGAVNNKGILQPVSHVVKTSKAGLG